MKKSSRLYEFIDSSGTFRSKNPDHITGLYFPLCNEAGLLSAITPNLSGDIKLDQHSFLTIPMTLEDLHLSRASRNFWITVGNSHWSVTGQSAWQKALPKGEESCELEAGFLWQKVKRSNKKMGLEASVTNFVPSGEEKLEIMLVEVKNISRKPILIKATSAIPLFGRSADNLRDHRQVTSLLNRISVHPNGVVLKPTMSFNERGHLKNNTSYFVLGADENRGVPNGFFPTMASFIGEGGSLEKPLALFDHQKPQKKGDEVPPGQEAMGGLQFKPVRLAPGKSASYILLLGIDPTSEKYPAWLNQYKTKDAVLSALVSTKASWTNEVSRVEFITGDAVFNNWIQWVQLQPTLRKIFGNSFLPDFDYGRGGRGWRDLWQDCLALLLFSPEKVRELIQHNFGGVRRDGTNATIIGKNKEFISDRNNITRTWMDHGVWPFLTTQLYLNQTGDWDLLLQKTPYFPGPQESGTILEHILVQNLVPFFNVGEHNNSRLEDADWNDGLDMAPERGESVAFTHMYAANLASIAKMLEAVRTKKGWTSVQLAKDLQFLLNRVTGEVIDYDRIDEKRKVLKKYRDSIHSGTGGQSIEVPLNLLIGDLQAKASWIKQHLNKQEWVEAKGHRWCNGYTDNQGKRVEGLINGKIQMTLTGQVYPIMAGTVSESDVATIVKAVDQFLFDKKLGGYRLNTNFGSEQPDLGRAFSFAFGEKENGAVFSHMAVMYANALYSRGYVKEGFRALTSLYRMAVNSQRSRIFPGIPEYFNNEGRGRYHYLTGSASWMILTFLTEVFGFRGQDGDLLLSPKLMPEQFDRKGETRVRANFAGCEVTVVYKNPKKVSYEKMKIDSVVDAAGRAMACERPSEKQILISRDQLKGKKNLTVVVSMAD